MYKIIFEDNSEFQGGDFEDSKWNEIPQKPIKRLEYTLVKETLVFENFEAYNHLVERVKFVNRIGGKITKVILMAVNKEKVIKIIYDFQSRKILQKYCILGQEYQGRSTTGWKSGIFGKEPKVFVL